MRPGGLESFGLRVCDPVTRLIVNVYQMIKTQQIHCHYQPKQSPSSSSYIETSKALTQSFDFIDTLLR